jgi:hypothetical protein
VTYDPNILTHRSLLAHNILEMLEVAGFTEEDTPAAKERVFSRQVDGTDRIRIMVYTSVVGGHVRQAGKDAIRVVAVYTTQDGKDRGILKETRVFRTGEIGNIVERIRGRMRDAWKRSKSSDRCGCGSPKFTSKKGSQVCAEICWVTPEERDRPRPAYRRRRWTR